jgi:hypothetical protein
MDDRFEVGRDLGMAILAAISEHQDRMRGAMGTEATVFEIIGVLTMIAGDYHNQLRRGATEEEE